MQFNISMNSHRQGCGHILLHPHLYCLQKYQFEYSHHYYGTAQLQGNECMCSVRVAGDQTCNDDLYTVMYIRS